MKVPPPLVLLLVTACAAEPAYSISTADAERYAQLRCQAVEQCCFDPQPGCVEHWRSTLLSWPDQGEGLVFSEPGLVDTLDWMETLGCAEEPPRVCRIATGSRGYGEPCIGFEDLGVYGDDCAAGLQCLSGMCVDDPLQVAQAPPGGFCDGIEWICEPERYCSTEGTCEPRVAPSEPCGESLQCLEPTSYYCAGATTDVSGTCTPRAEQGQPCVVGEDGCGMLCSGSTCERLSCVDETCQVPVRGPAVCEGDAA